jgi:hypothetical protein
MRPLSRCIELRALERSFDAITRRAVDRWCDEHAKGTEDVARIFEKARNMRANRSANAFFDRLRKPHDVKRWRLSQAIEHTKSLQPHSTSTRELEQV